MAERVVISIPRENVNDDSVLILSWKVPSGSAVEKEELICEVETSKVVLEIHAPASGFMVYECAAGQEVPVGAAICWIEPGPVNAIQPVSPQAAADITPARLSAAARRAADEYGLDVSVFTPGSLVRRRDVLLAAGKPETDTHPDGAAPVEWDDLPRRKRLESRILHRGRDLTLQCSVTSVCRVNHLAARLDELGLPAGGLQALIIFEAAHLLNKYPVFNAVCDGGRIGRYSQVNVGWALDGGQGLVVPVIREAGKKTVQEIAEVMQQQLEAYLENVLSPHDFSGGTFTVTDLSGQGVSFFQPLLAEGQSAILGVGKGPGPQSETILYLTLAFDHQLTEGKKAAEFLQELCERLETHASVGATAKEGPAPADAVRYCAVCHRDSRTLRSLNVMLLKSEVPPGLVCSLCVAGW